MALLPIPVWTVPPDWATNVVEDLEWLTGVFGSVSGAEQRQKLRLSPRRSFEFTVTAMDVWRTYLDALLSATVQDKFYLPVWTEVSSLTAAASLDDTVINVRGSRTELTAAGVLILRGDAPYEYALVEVTSVSAIGDNTQFMLADPLEFDWQRGTRVHPVVVARLTQQPQYTRLSDDVAQAALRFDLVQANDWSGAITVPTYRDFPVMEIETNESDTQGGSYFRLMDTVDNAVGIPFRRDLAGMGFPIINSVNFVYGRADNEALRSLLYSLQGRLAAFWTVFPSSDFKIHAPFLSSDTQITVKRNGFTDLGGPTVGRQDIRIKLRDGTSIYRRVVSSSILGDGITERLVLDSAFGVDATPREVARISFMALARLDQDLVQLTHMTDSDGTCSVSFAIKAVPDLRTGDDWFPPPFPLSNEGDCGPTVPGRMWVRRNNGLWNNDPAANPSFGDGGIDISILGGPIWPAAGMDTGFFGGGPQTTNFGGSPFHDTVPPRAAAWGVVATWNPSDASSGITLSGGNLTLSGGGEETGKCVRATSSSSSQFGLRYYEVTMTALSQGLIYGFANAAFNLEQGSGVNGAPDFAGVRGDGAIIVNGGSAGAIGALSPGDTLSLVVYTGAGI